MPNVPKRPQTHGSYNFDPEQFIDKWAKGEYGPPKDDGDFKKSIARAFGLRANDIYVYRAVAEVTLDQAQTYLNYGGQGRLHEWYRDSDGKQLAAPPLPDIQAYTSIFSPQTSTAKALAGLRANAKKASLRADIAAHLTGLYLPPPASLPSVPKLKPPGHTNPYLDLWTWSCAALEWGGPDAGTAETNISHALLPVLYHHFGCVCPSYDALVLIRQLAGSRPILDLGSGNGYWSFMLRTVHVPGAAQQQVSTPAVVPVDSGLSEWRTMWVGDTIAADGVAFLDKRAGGGQGDLLLLVYPQVSDDFTGKVLRAYKGSTVVVAGTQNGNGFTGFKGETIDSWMARERSEFELVLRIPLPSFAGKDEALFAFQRKEQGRRAVKKYDCMRHLGWNRLCRYA